ncbi:MAG: clostripain-related cysteine peptidase [Candidatus Heimdallarchaeota archaeon]
MNYRKTKQTRAFIFVAILLSLIVLTSNLSLGQSHQEITITTAPIVAEQIDLEAKDVPYTWVVMNYFDGDNNLEAEVLDDVNELEEGFGGTSIKVLALVDRTAGYDTTNGDWTSTRLYDISYDDTDTITSTLVQDYGELNMGAGATLEAFIDYCFANYGADHYWLNLWDHGGGIDGICWDDTNSGDKLTMDEMQTAIQNSETTSGKTLDVISHDACLMNMIEVAYELRDLADYFVASEESVPGDGFDYYSIIDYLVTNPGSNASALSEELVDTYETFYDPIVDYVTISALNLTAMDAFEYDVNQFAGNLSIVVNDGQGASIDEAFFNTLTFYDEYIVDFQNFVEEILTNATLMAAYTNLETAANNLITEFSSLIVANYQHSVYSGDANGVSIFMPYYNTINSPYITHYLDVDDSFTGMDWQTGTLWDEFLDDFYSNGFGVFGAATTPITLGSPTGSTSIGYGDNHLYSITLTELGVYLIEMHVITGDADVQIYDPITFDLYGFSAFYNPDDSSVESIQVHLDPGTYNIIVEGYEASNYDLTISKITIPTITLGQTVTGSSGTPFGEDDHYLQTYNFYYQITISVEGTYTFELTYNSLVVDFDLYVYYTNFALVGVSESTGDVDSMEILFDATYTLIVCIYGYSGHGSFSFATFEEGGSPSPTGSTTGIFSGYTWIIGSIGLLALVAASVFITKKKNLH